MTHLGLRRLALPALLLALAGCGGKSAPAAPVASCSDGLKNGTETGVDCGGSCGATCSLGVACSASSDCLFGSCPAGTCAAPTTGPSPTGPVTALVPPEGATLTAVTTEHVSVSLVFPAGAVAAPLQVTLTPQPLTGRGWFSVAVEPAGMLLAAPASVHVTLPASVPATAAADGLMLFTGAADASLLPTTATGLALSAPVRALGVPGFIGGPPSVPVVALASAGVRPSALLAPRGAGRAGSLPLNLLIGLPMNLATRIALADNLITLLAATGRNRDALEVAALVVAILSRMGEPAVEAQVRAFMGRTWSSACGGFNVARSAMVADTTVGHPACPAEAIRFTEPVMNWVLVLQQIEAYSTAGCANYTGMAWIDDVGRANQAAIDTEKTDIVKMWRCDCAETPPKEWTPQQRGHCLTLGFTGLTAAGPASAAVAPADVPTTELEWDHLTDTVARAYEEASLLGYEGLDAPAATERTLLADPHLKLARSLAFAGCRRDGTQKPVARLLAVVPDLPALLDDGQYCATELGARQTNASGGVVAQLSSSLGGVDADQKRLRDSLSGAKSGTLSLSGPIAALYCPPGSAAGSEQLVIKLDGATLQTLSTAPYLTTPLDLDVATALETAHPGTTGALDRATLTVERTGVPCDGAWGATPAPLLSLDLDFAPRIAFACSTPTSPNGADLCTVNPDGSGLEHVVVDGIAPAWSHDRSRIAFILHNDLMITGVDGTGQFKVPLPANTWASSLSWAPDDTQLAFTETSLAFPPTVCFVGTDGSGHRCLPYTTFVHNTDGSYPSGMNPEPSWSPDGAFLLATVTTFQGLGPPKDYHSNQDVFLMTSAGDGLVNLTNNTGQVLSSTGVWSPDGTHIAYAREDDALPAIDVYVMTRAGGVGTRVTTSGTAMQPAWSPDGTRIVYADLGTGKVMIINADGSGVPTELASGYDPAW